MGKDEYWTQRWWDLQGYVLEAAEWTCSDCGWRATVAHHLTYRDGIICSPENLVPLCNQCHRVRHGLSNWRREHKVDYMRRQGWVRVSELVAGGMRELGYFWKRAGS